MGEGVTAGEEATGNGRADQARALARELARERAPGIVARLKPQARDMARPLVAPLLAEQRARLDELLTPTERAAFLEARGQVGRVVLSEEQMALLVRVDRDPVMMGILERIEREVGRCLDALVEATVEHMVNDLLQRLGLAGEGEPRANRG